MSPPFVSVICPTYNRHRFLPMVIHQFQQQTYHKDRMELVILDDTAEPFDIAPYVAKDPRIRYYHETEKMLIPVKRNRLNKLAKGDIIVSMDDDDFYYPSRVKHAVTKLTGSKALLAGSTELLIYDCKTKKGYKIGPYHARHGTNGTFAYKKELLKDHYYEEDTDKNYAEEKFFTKDFTTDMVQLNPWDTMICFNHSTNTFDKSGVLQQKQIVKELKLDLKKLVKDKKTREFFTSLRGRDKPQVAPGIQE